MLACLWVLLAPFTVMEVWDTNTGARLQGPTVLEAPATSNPGAQPLIWLRPDGTLHTSNGQTPHNQMNWVEPGQHHVLEWAGGALSIKDGRSVLSHRFDWAGDAFIALSNDGQLVRARPNAGSTRRFLPQIAGAQALRFVDTPQGQRLMALALDERHVHVLAPPEWRPVATHVMPGRCRARSLRVVDDALLLICDNTVVHVTEKTLTVLPQKASVIDVDRNGRVALNQGRSVVFVDTHGAQRRARLDVCKDKQVVNALTVSADGRFLGVECGYDGHARIFGLATGQQLHAAKIDADNILGLRFAQGALWVWTEREGLPRIDPATGQLSVSRPGVGTMRPLPDGSAVWMSRGDICVGQLGARCEHIYWTDEAVDVDVAHDGQLVAAATASNGIIFWRLDGAPVASPNEGCPAKDSSSAPELEACHRRSAHGPFLFDGPAKGRPDATRSSPPHLIAGPEFTAAIGKTTRVFRQGMPVESPDLGGKTIALVGHLLVWIDGARLQVHDLRTGLGRVVETPHTAWIKFERAGQADDRLTTVDLAGLIVTWRVPEMTVVSTIRVAADGVRQLDFSRKGRFMVTRSIRLKRPGR